MKKYRLSKKQDGYCTSWHKDVCIHPDDDTNIRRTNFQKWFKQAHPVSNHYVSNSSRRDTRRKPPQPMPKGERLYR